MKAERMDNYSRDAEMQVDIDVAHLDLPFVIPSRQYHSPIPTLNSCGLVPVQHTIVQAPVRKF